MVGILLYAYSALAFFMLLRSSLPKSEQDYEALLIFHAGNQAQHTLTISGSMYAALKILKRIECTKMESKLAPTLISHKES